MLRSKGARLRPSSAAARELHGTAVVDEEEARMIARIADSSQASESQPRMR